MAPSFSRSPEFAIDKDAGQPCPNLDVEFRCAIHASLREQGFPGCTLFDCFGAGQQVSQVTFGGRDWRQDPGTATQMFRVFAVVQQLHELLWCLDSARQLGAARPLLGELTGAFDDIKRLTYGSPGELAGLDVATYQRRVNALLLRTGQLVRAAAHPSAAPPATVPSAAVPPALVRPSAAPPAWAPSDSGDTGAPAPDD